MLKLLAELKQENLISELNYQFAKWIDNKQQAYEYSPTQQNLTLFLAALLSFHVMQGHSCLRLDSSIIENPFGLKNYQYKRDYFNEILQKIERIPALEWQSYLAEHIAFSDNPEHVAPMLFQHNRLYFYRYWQAEHRIARKMQQTVQTHTPDSAENSLNQAILAQFFIHQSAKIDWQKVAVATALAKKFCLISGGPGTGKTYTVAILLAALQLKQLKLGLAPLNIALAAPTGKAAARLKESITHSLLSLVQIPDELKQLLPNSAKTLHSLLGIRPNRDLPHYNADNPLHVDLLVVDEASMIDLFVMEKLFNALKPTTRLILLGDKDQLASVEAGNAMSELGELLPLGYSKQHCDYLQCVTGYELFSSNSQVPAVCDSLCHLRESRRFSEYSGIGYLAAQINAKQAGNSWQSFANSAFSDLQLITYPAMTNAPEKTQWQQQCVKLVVQQAVQLYRPYLSLVKQRQQSPASISVAQIFAAFSQVRFLSALRVSELGVENLNQEIAEALRQCHLIEFNQSRESYIGKPILITENAAQLHIFSGDIGLMLPDEQGKLRIYFDTNENGQYLNISPSRVPNYEPAYVMTVHKSQGSEFAHTLMVMPHSHSPVLSKELLYTAVTRAKEKFTLFSSERIWKNAVRTDIQRQSGLREQILAN
ncbi:exodeoxyribonuclease V subunit alpha [Bibersteinia trehalosi]|uniref:RecBCD enzyme subunit RecD n=1 Tax=Bibersteinia trehalosi TaxID=47735 RepID=A0A426FII2_BIBTR|nr:exodeoxyribonuclease V subunit alpha [Bibersteinia trehalosi]RRN04539.1 exodeoxyribonuclease V subunit alpha [Bibersteinia trehalosi]